MGIYTTKPISELSKLEFRELLINKKLIISNHAIDHLSAKQRKIFKEEEILHIIERENPRKIYLQENQRYALYYRKSDGYRKIIIELEKENAVIVSFMDLFEIPRIKLKNGK